MSTPKCDFLVIRMVAQNKRHYFSDNDGGIMFTERLLELMKEKNVSIRQISADVGFGVNQIKYWKTHGTVPKADTVENIASYLGVSADYLLGKEEQKENTPEELKLSEGEAMLLEAIRDVPEEERPALLKDLLRIALKNQK